MMARWADLRDAEFAAKAIHAVFGGQAPSERIRGTIDRCAAPLSVRAGCGRFCRPSRTHPAREHGGRPIPRITHICTNVRDCEHRRSTLWHSPMLIIPDRDRVSLTAAQRTWVRRVVQEASGRTEDGMPSLVALAAAVHLAAPGTPDEERALAALDERVKSRDAAKVVSHRIEAQERLAAHLAHRTRRDHPERRAAR